MARGTYHMWLDEASELSEHEWNVLRANERSRDMVAITTSGSGGTQARDSYGRFSSGVNVPFPSDEHNIPVGALVELIDESFGWGNFKSGMVGTVLEHVIDEHQERCYNIDVPSVGTYHCKEKDIRAKSDRVLQSCSVTQFYNRQRALIETQLKEYTDKLSAEHNPDMVRVYMRRVRSLKRIISCMCVPDTDVFKMVQQKIESTRFEGDVLTIKTKDIIVPYHIEASDMSIRVPLGTFKVYCNFASKTTAFAGLMNNTSYEGRRHPHLSGNSPCWGTYGDIIARCYKNLDVCALISTILDFLNSCDRDGWYASILGFARGNLRDEIGNMCYRCEYEHCECEDRCGDCDNHVDDCTCNRCSDCGSHEDSCECVRCPDSGEQLTDNSFPDGDCAQCNSLVRNLDSGTWRCSREDWLERQLSTYAPPENTRDRHEYRTISNGKELEQ